MSIANDRPVSCMNEVNNQSSLMIIDQDIFLLAKRFNFIGKTKKTIMNEQEEHQGKQVQ